MQSEVRVRALTYVALDYISFSSLTEAMKKFPEINDAFKLNFNLTYDLRRYVCKFSITVNLLQLLK